MEPYLELTFRKNDPSKIWVRGANENFAGAAEQYINDEEINLLAENLKAFPSSTEATVTFEAGKNESTHGYCKLHFYCFDSTGHTAVQISLANELASNEDEDNRCMVVLKLQFEPVELDRFVSTLNEAINNGGGVATLKGVRRFTENVHP
jgi:hypothetical protein